MPASVPPPLSTAIVPPRIRRGETLGIVAPAGPVKIERLTAGLARLGDAFDLRIADSITAPRNPDVPSYLVADDDLRAAEVNAMLADADVRAILLARGGYGLMRILHRLDGDLLRADPKPIIGFSDGTAILSWAYSHGVRGVHGPVAVQLAQLSPEDVSHLIDVITDVRVPGVRPWSLQAHGTGQHRGPLVTGNLTMMSLLVGTPWALPLDGALALIEEVGERPYEIDRYLTQLTLTGTLARCAAMIVGDLTRCVDGNPPTGVPDPDDAALRVVLERMAMAEKPVASGAPIGHGDRNEAVGFGAQAILDLDAGTLDIREPAVA
jgi:muramoyltetrapeptide carboxypeptidase